MNTQTLAVLKRTLQSLLTARTANLDTYQDEFADSGDTGGVWQGIAGRSQELLDVTEEVAAEQQARLAMVSLSPHLARRTLAYLRQQTLPDEPGPVAQEGVWLLVSLSAPCQDAAAELNGQRFGYPLPDEDGYDGANGFAYSDEFNTADTLGVLRSAAVDVLLYLVDAGAGWQDADAQWYARLRALGIPILPVLITINGAGVAQDHAQDSEPSADLRTRLAVRPAMLGIRVPPQVDGAKPDEPPQDVGELTQRLLAMRPRVAIPLAQDIPWCRHAVATRIIRSGALITGLVGAEPIPLLDLPLHVALHWKVALQLAAIHGRPGLDYRSREMAGTIAVNLAMRYLAQQVLKLIPFVGWLLSGLLGALSTFLLGHALLRYYENDRIWSWQATRQAWQTQSKRLIDPPRTRSRVLGRRVRQTGQAAVRAWQDQEEE